MIDRAGSIATFVANTAHKTSENVAILERAPRSVKRYAIRMLSEWLREQIDDRGMAQSELARRLTAELKKSIDRAAVNKMLSGKRQISAEEVLAIERILQVRLPRDEPLRISEAEEYELEQADAYHREASSNPAYSPENYRPKVKGAVPEIDGQLGAGEGEIGETLALPLGGEVYSGHRIVEEWLFPEQYLRSEIGTSISKTIVMPVKGDSMEPTYRPGDRVLVDLTQTTLTEDTVYVISDGQSAPRIKRLVEVMFSKPRRVLIVSDNTAIGDQEVELAELTIIGRVVGAVSRR